MNYPSYIGVCLILVAIVLLLLDFENGKNQQPIQIRLKKLEFTSARHKWQKSQLRGFYFCNVCRGIMAGLFNTIYKCKICTMHIHSFCRAKYKFTCKYITSNKQTQKNLHQWIEGNLPTNSICIVCKHICTNSLGLDGKTCLWCQKVIHKQCIEKLHVQCDYGQWKKGIIQPCQVKNSSLKSISSFGYKKKKKKEQKSSDESQTQNQDIIFRIPQQKQPLIVIINKKSGGQIGNQILGSFYKYLNPLQVISVIDQGLQSNLNQLGLKLFSKLKKVKIIIGGGDGTVCTTINYLKSGVLKQWSDKNPPIAILPLGTGNDLSRSLGWGGCFDSLNVQKFILKVLYESKTLLLDRWQVVINNLNKQKEQYFFGKNVHYMYNYMGLGLDAKYCLNFHQLRNSHPFFFFSQIFNKFIYSQIGTLDFINKKITKTTENLNNIRIYIDENQINLQGLENIIVLNIPYWSGGVTNLWKHKYKQNQNQQFQKSSFSDGKIQVIGIQNVVHLGQVQIGMDQPIKIGQGRCLRIQVLEGKFSVHIDGQPFQMIGPLSIVIKRVEQVYMLNSCQKEYEWQSKVIRVLEECLQDKIIDQRQKCDLMQRLNS